MNRNIKISLLVFFMFILLFILFYNYSDFKNKDSYDYNISKAIDYEKDKDFTNAYKHVNKVLENNPNDNGALNLKNSIENSEQFNEMSICENIFRKDEDKGEICIKEYISRYPDDETVCRIYKVNKKFEKAYKCYERFIPEDIDNTEYDLEKCSSGHKGLSSSEKEKRRKICLEIRRYNRVFLEKCHVLVKFGEKEDIKKCYDNALRIFDIYKYNFDDIGDGYYAIGYFTDAMKAYNIYLKYLKEDNSEDFDIELKICKTIAKLKNNNEYEKCLKSLGEKYPDQKDSIIMEN